MGAAPVAPLRARLTGAEPQLFVADLAASLAFYTGRLGFELAFRYGHPPFYAQVARGRARLNLRLACGPVFDAGFREREADALSAAITVDDVETLFREFDGAAVDFHQPLRREDWAQQPSSSPIPTAT